MKKNMKNLSNDFEQNSKIRRTYCENPWNINCGNEDIVVYIRYKSEQKPICRDCWKEIADNEYEW